MLFYIVAVALSLIITLYGGVFYKRTIEASRIKSVDGTSQINAAKGGGIIGSIGWIFGGEGIMNIVKENIPYFIQDGVHLGFYFTVPIFMMSDPAILEKFMAKPDSEYTRPKSISKLHRYMVGNGVLPATGQDWARQHRILYKAFSKQNVRNFLPLMIEETNLCVERLLSRKGEPFDLQAEIELTSLRIITRTSFCFSDKNDPRISELRSLFNDVVKGLSVNDKIPFARYLNPLLKKGFDSGAKLKQLALDILDERKKLRESGEVSSDKVKYIIDIILDANAEEDDPKLSLSDEEMRDNALIFLAAGSETAAGAVIWCIINLVEHPELYSRLLRDIDEYMDANNSQVGSDLMEKIPYLRQCIEESMRITPSVTVISTRVPHQDQQVGKFIIPEGIRVMTMIPMLHHNPKFWNNSFEYNPENFNDENKPKQVPGQFVPFGTGRRICMGKTFAYEILYTLIPILLHKIKFEKVSEEKIESKAMGPVLKFKGKPMFKASMRSH